MGKLKWYYLVPVLVHLPQIGHLTLPLPPVVLKNLTIGIHCSAAAIERNVHRRLAVDAE